jgi:LysR family carnitine catabolism transcriptional activator
MDERRLRYFLTVVDEGGVTAAARRLVIAQPSLSQALRAFEQELGVELFHRTGRGLKLSSAGTALIGPAREILRATEAARAAVQAVADVLAGTLELAAIATLAVDPLAGLLGSFRRAHPQVKVRVAEPEGVAGVRSLVADGDCELGLLDIEPTPPGFEIVPLGTQELMVVLPRGARGSKTLTADQLARLPLVVSPPGTSTRTLLEQALGDTAGGPEIAVETAAREAIVPLVLAGAGAALLPAPLAAEAERRGAVIRRMRPAITRPIGLIHRAHQLSPAARAFVELVRTPGAATSG